MPVAFPQALVDFLDPSPVGIFAIDREGIIVYVNPKQCENSRLTRDELVGKNYRAFFSETLKSHNLLDHFDRLQQDGVTFAVTIPAYRRHADGTLLALNVKGYQQGEYTFILTTIERALQTEQARFAQLFEHANDGIFIMDRQGCFVAVNPKFTEMTGLPKEEIIGKTTELFLPGRFAQSLERLERIMREGRLGPYELEITTPLGQKVFSLNGFALSDGDTPEGVMNIVCDVTAERSQHRQQEALYALAHDLVRLTDTCGVGQRLFARTQELLGAEHGWLLLLDETGTELTAVAVGGVYAETWIQERIPLQEPDPATVALRERRIVVVPDLAQSPLASTRIRTTYAVVTTVVGIPLYHGETAVGSFVVGWERQRDFSPQEIALLETLGNEAALALVRVRLTEQLRESEVRYRGLVENANDAIVTLTLEGIVTGVNRGLEVMLGWSRKELNHPRL